MDRKKMLQVLLPAGAAGGMVLLVGLLIALGDGGSTATTANIREKTSQRAAAFDDSGMTDTLPDVTAPEWKAGPGLMKVWDVAEGEGDPCPKGATVTIHYTGWTTDGKVFDSSRKELSKRPTDGAPATFPLGTLVRGWQEGIPGMKPGGIRRLYIPYAWAYGEAGRPPSIPPRADLIFEIKLLEWTQ